MSEFWIYFDKGFRHIATVYAYNHILFLLALSIPYSFKEWKRVLIVIVFFIVGYSLASLLAIFGVVIIKANLVDRLIPITILFVTLYNLFISGKSSKQGSASLIGLLILFFGIIHGLGFEGHFKNLGGGSAPSKLITLTEFSIGIVASQISVVLIVLTLSYFVQTFFRLSRRDWILVMSAFVIGVLVPAIIQIKF